jgi:3-hydroxyacyl-CoA dehydrogenase
MADILLSILEQMKETHPNSDFISSLHQQYCNRGGLSRKQLEGLYAKAVKANSLGQAKLATLEAIIKKKPTRERAAATIKNTEQITDELTGNLLAEILLKYPQHKRLVFLKAKFDKDKILSPVETEEVKKFGKLLLR